MKGMGVFLPPAVTGLSGLALSILAAAPFSLPLLFLTFLKIGSILYGSGYVLLAFLRSDFVVRLGWLTDAQLIDAVAIGQVTWRLGQASLVDPLTIAVGLVSLLLLVRFKINTTGLIAGGALLGLLRAFSG